MTITRRFTGKALGLAVVLIAVAIAVLMALGPSGLQAWTPPAASVLPNVVSLTGQPVGEGVCEGSRGLAVDAAGRAYVLCKDEGDIVTLAANAANATTFLARVPGGAGLGFGPMGGLVVAGGKKGLLHVGGRPEPAPLVTTKDDPSLRFVSAVDDFKLTPEVLFLNLSDQAVRPRVDSALLEHAGRGSLHRYDWRSKQSTTLLEGLQSPLAVAIGPDDSYALVAETGAYRILRYWLSGPRAGTHEIFVDQLPGFVTALSFNRNGRFWATLATGRHASFDMLAGFPRLRSALSVLHWRWLPLADDSLAIGFDPDGHVATAFRLQSGPGIGRMTQVVEHGPWLWIASDRSSGLVRVPLQSLVSTALPPPDGWQSTPRRPKQSVAKPPEDDD